MFDGMGFHSFINVHNDHSFYMARDLFSLDYYFDNLCC